MPIGIFLHVPLSVLLTVTLNFLHNSPFVVLSSLYMATNLTITFHNSNDEGNIGSFQGLEAFTGQHPWLDLTPDAAPDCHPENPPILCMWHVWKHHRARMIMTPYHQSWFFNILFFVKSVIFICIHVYLLICYNEIRITLTTHWCQFPHLLAIWETLHLGNWTLASGTTRVLPAS